MSIPEIESTPHIAESTLSIIGTFFVTSGGYSFVVMLASICYGFTRLIAMRPNTKEPKPKPQSTMPVTKPFLSGKSFQLL